MRADRLRQAIEDARRRDLPTKEVARRSKVHEQSIYNAMGKSGFGIKVAQRLAPVLGVSPTWLAGIDAEPAALAPPPPQVPWRIREWGEWMDGLPADARRIVLRVGDALRDASRKARSVRSSTSEDKGHRSRRRSGVG